MTNLGPPTNPQPGPGGKWFAFATCPGCGTRAALDEDQARGRVSMDCTVCDYHETHDLTEALAA